MVNCMPILEVEQVAAPSVTDLVPVDGESWEPRNRIYAIHRPKHICICIRVSKYPESDGSAALVPCTSRMGVAKFVNPYSSLPSGISAIRTRHKIAGSKKFV